MPGQKTTLREAQKQFTSERLKQAALQVFERHGYRDATVDLIANEAGTSRATLYLHFEGKSGLLAELAHDTIADDLPVFYGQLDSALVSEDPEELRSWVRRWLAWLEEHRVLIDAADDAAATRDTKGLVAAGFSDYMPKYRERWKGHEREAAVRISFLLMLVSSGLRTATRIATVEGEVDDELVVSMTVDLLSAMLADPPRKTP